MNSKPQAHTYQSTAEDVSDGRLMPGAENIYSPRSCCYYYLFMYVFISVCLSLAPRCWQ